jgi:hypothetical protein
MHSKNTTSCKWLDVCNVLQKYNVMLLTRCMQCIAKIQRHAIDKMYATYCKNTTSCYWQDVCNVLQKYNVSMTLYFCNTLHTSSHLHDVVFLLCIAYTLSFFKGCLQYAKMCLQYKQKCFEWVSDYCSTPHVNMSLHSDTLF